MTRARLVALVGAGFLGGAMVATAIAPVPQAVRIVVGVLAVFLVPGLALGLTVLVERCSRVELLLASVGLSLTLATCGAVLLAATPVALSRESFGVFLGGLTIVLSLCGIGRVRSTRGPLEPTGPWVARREGQLGRARAVTKS